MGGIIMEKVNVSISSDCVNIIPPTGYVIDEENSTFNCIKFKPIQKRWRDDDNVIISGYYINKDSKIIYVPELWNVSDAYNTFATEKQVKSALAMARISQIMANDERFGGVVTDEEWQDEDMTKFVIKRKDNGIFKVSNIFIDTSFTEYCYLAFHTTEQLNLFLKENEDLVHDYLML